MRGERWHGAKGGRGEGGVQFETKSRAEEVKERNNVEGSSHTNTLHTHTSTLQCEWNSSVLQCKMHRREMKSQNSQSLL